MEIAAAFTDSVTEGICRKLKSALEETGHKKLVLASGVAANSHLRKAVEKSAAQCGAEVFIPPVSLCGDNGAMVGAQTYFEYTAGVRADSDLNAYASGEGAAAAQALKNAKNRKITAQNKEK